MQAILSENEYEKFSGLTIGKVFKLYPQGNMVDVMLMDGTFLDKVQVMTSYASSRAGSTGLPNFKYEKEFKDRDAPFSNAKQGEADVFVVIGFLGGEITRPIAFGFLYPEENEVLCGRDQKGNEDGTQFLWKHESNVYVRVAKGYKGAEGSTDPITPDIEISHPSGLYIKIGRNAGSGYPTYTSVLEPVVNWDKDIRPFKKLNPDSNKADPAPYIHIYHPSGDYITIEPDGDVVEFLVKDVDRTIKGNVTELVEGNVGRTIKGNVTETIEGNLNRTIKLDETEVVEGNLDVTVKADVTELIEGSLDKTVKVDVDETVEGSVTKNVTGTETDTVTGAWARSSNASIDDTAPIVTHN